MARRVSQHRRVLEHARRAGVSHVVRLSAIGASAASPIALMRDHAAAVVLADPAAHAG